jgi:hypothetical protein
VRSARRRHAQFYCELLEWAAAQDAEEEGTSRARRAILDSEKDNILAAQKWAADHIDTHSDAAALVVKFHESLWDLLEHRQESALAGIWLKAAIRAYKKLDNKDGELRSLRKLLTPVFESFLTTRERDDYYWQEFNLRTQITIERVEQELPAAREQLRELESRIAAKQMHKQSRDKVQAEPKTFGGDMDE